MTDGTAIDASATLFAGDGEVRSIARTVDWATTPLGPIPQWPAALRLAVRTALESPFPVNLWCGPELVLIYNDAYTRVLGAKHPSALGRRGAEVWAEIWDDIGWMFEQMRAGGPPVFAEDARFVMQRAGDAPGAVAWFTFSLSPVRDDSGAIVAFLNIATETTGRVLADRRLTEVFRQAPSFLAVLRGPTHVFETANEAYRQLVGHREIVGRTVADALPEVVEQGFVAILDQVLATGEPFIGRELPVMLAPRAGVEPTQHFLDFVYQPFVEGDGVRSGVIVHGSDVTEQVLARRDVERLLGESEAARAALVASETGFRAVQDASPDASLLARAVRDERGAIRDFVFTYANAATQTILIGGAESVLRRTMRDAFPESVAAGRLDVYARVVETGVPWQQDVFYTRGDVAHGLRVTAVKVGDGVHIGAVDLSDRIRTAHEREQLLAQAQAARAEAERARAAAEEANRAKAEFLATMSHELRTPLNAIGGYAELVELGIHGPVTPAQAQALQRIQTSQRHLLGLINEVLNYSRIEAGAVQYDLEPVLVTEALAVCEALTAPQMRAKGLVATFDDADHGYVVVADRDKLQQIVLNLLSNAIKFTERGGHITVTARASGDQVAIDVADTGVGIPGDRLASVFEPFVQVDARFTRTQEGVGLGLAISRDLARGMQGDLTAASVPNAGSVFTLTLPTSTRRRGQTPDGV